MSKYAARCDFVETALSYAREAVADTKGKKHGLLIRLAAKRFLGDLERTKEDKPPFKFSKNKANLFCELIEQFPHVEGRWESRCIRLIPAQMFFIVQLVGFRSLEGGRRFTTALFAVSRKNAKSTLAAATILALSMTEREEGFQTYSAATTGDQARIVWNIAKRMVEKMPEWKHEWNIETYARSIEFFNEGGTFKALNAKASTQDGLNPTYVNLDELHAHPNHDLINVLQSASGARQNPLFLYTTTEGYENPGPWAEQRDFAEKVLEGGLEADHYLAIMFRLDEKDDDFDESKWIKANPLMETNPLIMREMQKMAIEAKAMPGKLSEFRIKRLNRRSSTAEGFVLYPTWLENGGKIDLKKLEREKCYAALDIASVLDMTAWRLVWQLDDDEFVTWGRFFVPGKQVKLRNERKLVPYKGWAQSGWLTVTEGDVTDYRILKRDIMEDCDRFNPEVVGYDPWNAAQLANELIEEGVNLQQFIQGTKSYNPAMKAFERAYMKKKLLHDNNPILNWNMANLIARKDVNDNIAPDRKKSKDKIDGAACLIMCMGLSEANKSSYVTGTVVAA